MALEFMKIPGLQKILTSLDFKSYLIGVDKLPDYRDASFCTYSITEDAEARSGKIYYNRVPQAKGGYSYDPCSHTKLNVVDHLMAAKPYEICKIKPDAFLVIGKDGAGDGASTLFHYCTFDNSGKLETVSLDSIVISNDKYLYYYRDVESKSLKPLTFIQTSSGLMIRARRNFYGRPTSGTVEPGGLPSPAGNTYWYLNGDKWTAIPSSTVGSVATYEETNNRVVYLRVKTDEINTLNALTLYNCGWYLGHVNSETIYNVDLKMGALTEYNISAGSPMAERALSYTNDTVFVRDKVYYIKKTDLVLDKVTVHNTSSELDVSIYNVNWLFSNFVVLSKSDPEIGYGGYASVAAWKADHPDYELYEETTNFWIQPDGFVGTLTRNHDWYERVGDRFPYAGFVAIATSKYNGQQIGGFYHAKMKEYQLTEDTVHHFRWLDEDHTQAESKTYYEWNDATNVYTPRDGSPGNLIYRAVDGTDYFQKPMTSVFEEGETYYTYSSGSGYTELTGWTPVDPIPGNVFIDNRPFYYRNGWTITEVETRYGVTTDTTVVAGKQYFISTGTNSFSQIGVREDGSDFFTTTNDDVFKEGKQYYYCDRDNASKTGLQKFTAFDSSAYIGKSINSQSRTIYERNKDGGIPTEVQICVKFDKYDGRFDGITIPNDVDVVVESLNGEPILQDAYYEACKGMYVWEQYFIERGTSVTKPYNVQAVYIDSESKVTLNLMWTDPKFMLHKDDPTMAPDAWAKTDVDLEYEKDENGAKVKRVIRLVSEVATNDVYADNFFTVDGDSAITFDGATISRSEFSTAVKTGVIRITATAVTGITSEYVVRPSKVVWVNSTKGFVSLLGGTAVTGVRYYTINSDGNETELADVVPYVTDVSSDKIYIKYQKEIETYVDDDNGVKRMIIIGDSAHKDGTIVPENVGLFTRVTENPEITVREIVRAGLFDKLFASASGGYNLTGALLGQVPLTTAVGSNPDLANVTVVDSDGVSLGYNIEQGYVDVLQGETREYITLDPHHVYYTRQSVTEKACNADEADANNVYYEFAKVVDITKFYEDTSGRFSNTEANKGILFSRSSDLPHYRHYINSKNVVVRGATDLFEVGVTYSVRKEGVVEFVTLHPDYRGPDSGEPKVTTTQYYYYTGVAGDLWDAITMKSAAIQPANGAVYLDQPSNGKANRLYKVTTGTFESGKIYYGKTKTVGQAGAPSTYSLPVKLDAGVDYEVDGDIADKASETNLIYRVDVEDIDTNEADFSASWAREDSTSVEGYGLWKFMGWKFYPNRKYYIHYNDTPGGPAEYHIGENVLAWSSAHDTAVYVERPGVSEFLDVTDFGIDALRGCTVPLYIKDKAIVDKKKQDVYVALDRPRHSATFRYQYPLNQQAFVQALGADPSKVYWDESGIRSTLAQLEPTLGDDPDETMFQKYMDYVEFYENHIIPAISTVFKNWRVVGEGEGTRVEFDTARVFDKFWIPCLGNFVQDEVYDHVNGAVISGIPSEDGGLDLYAKGIGQAHNAEALKMARQIHSSASSNTHVVWALRTCPRYTAGGTPVVIAVDADGNFVTRNKLTSLYIVPHFTIA